MPQRPGSPSTRPIARRLAVPLAAVLTLPALALVSSQAPAHALTYDRLTPIQKRLLSGAASFALSGDADQQLARSAGRSQSSSAKRADPACPSTKGSNVKVNQNCLNLTDADLQGRGQAQNETSIAQNPLSPKQLVASFNDYRRGDGNCYTSWSADGGQSWNDSTVPMGFTRGTAFGNKPREYWQAGGDTSVAWDSRGNAYLSCQVFKRGAGVTSDVDQSSAFYLFRSTGTGGASWNFPGRPIAEHDDRAGEGEVLLDKQLIAVDSHVSSPFRDRVYVSWTLFDDDGTSYIYEAYSADYGESFSAPVLVSRDSPLCVNTFGADTPHGKCNTNQFSQPFVGPDGALYITWANFNNGIGRPVGDPDAGGTVGGDGLGGGNSENSGQARASGTATTGASTAATPTPTPSATPSPTPNPLENYNQIFLAKSTDGGASFGAPVLVGQYYDLPDCATYQNGADAGRACVPETGSTTNSVFRATNYPVGSVNPKTGAVAVTYGSYLNKDSNESNGCAPNGFSGFGINLYTGVKKAGACNNDILLSVSSDGGTSFTGGSVNPRALTVVRQDKAGATADQFWQWADFAPDGTLAVSFRDRGYGDDQVTGYTDTSVAGSRNLTKFETRRASNVSSPPPTGFAGLFLGDYEGLTAVSDAHPIWTDTRDPSFVLCPGTGTPGNPPAACTTTSAGAITSNDANAYSTSVGVPRP